MVNDAGTGKDARFLTKEEELELGRLIQAHYKALELLETEVSVEEREELEQVVAVGREAVDKLVRANLGLVHERARRYKMKVPSAPDMEDLVQSGTLGLMNAVKKYDPSMDNKFSTVAWSWIGQAIARETNKTGRVVRLPENRINDFTHMNRIVNSEEAKGKTSEEVDALIRERLGISQQDIVNIRQAAYAPASLNKVVGSDSGSTKELIDFISETKEGTSVEGILMNQELMGVLGKQLATLTDLEKDVISASFGFDPELTPKKVRERYGIQQYRFKKLQREILGRMAEDFQAKGFTATDFA